MKISDFIEQYHERYPNKVFISEFNERFPAAELFDVATEEMLQTYEEKLGFRLPPSFREFLMTFSNGIFLLGWEPIGGVSPHSPCGEICLVERIIPNVPEKVLIEETYEFVEANRLISLTTFDAGEISNDHWVFICDDNVADYDYRLGYIGQSCRSIVKVVKNFEEWLEIFWKGNKNSDRVLPTFYVLYPDYDERGKILYEWLR